MNVDERYCALVAWLGRRRITVQDAPLSCSGEWLSIDRTILLDATLSGLWKFKTLVHESAHALMYEMCKCGELDLVSTRDAKEVYAELTAMLVCDYLGFDTSEYSWKYIQSYVGSLGGWKHLEPLARYSARRLYTIIS